MYGAGVARGRGGVLGGGWPGVAQQPGQRRRGGETGGGQDGLPPRRSLQEGMVRADPMRYWRIG